MKLSKIILMVLLVVAILLCVSVGSAQVINGTDTENHIDCDNDDWAIPSVPLRMDESTGWYKDGRNLITNFYSMYQPEVEYIEEWDDGEHYPYLMWFFAWAYTQENDPSGMYPGYPGGDAIFVARAKALEGPWEIYSKSYTEEEYYWDTEMKPQRWFPVITCQDTSVWYDSWHVGDPSVVYKDGVFYMAYSAMGCDVDGIPSHKGGDTDGNASCIMGATSTDGIHWTRTTEPLLIWENEKQWQKNAFDKSGYVGEYQRPSLMYEDGKWKMWYDYRSNQLGYAECDGDFGTGTWTRFYTNVNGNCNNVDFEVIKIGSVYYAYADPYVSWYSIRDLDIPYYSGDGSGWSQRQIVEFQSLDGQHWKCTGYMIPDDTYDACQIPQPFIDRKNNRVCVFYATQRGVTHSRYGNGTYDWGWDNIRFVWKSLDDFATGADVATTPTPAPTPTPTPTPTAIPTVTAEAYETSTIATTLQPTQTVTAAPTAETNGDSSSTAVAVLVLVTVVAAASVAIAVVFSKRKNR